MKFIVDYDEGRWIILILCYTLYLGIERFWTTLLICCAFDFLVSVFKSPVAKEWIMYKIQKSRPSTAGGGGGVDIEKNTKEMINIELSLVIDVLLRIMVIFVGMTINAMSGYAFDLTFYRGKTGILVFIVFLIYALFYFMVDMYPDAQRYSVMIIDTAFPWSPVIYKTADRNHVDWRKDFVLLFLLLIATLACTETIVFSEPWTFATFFVYFISVLFLMLVSRAFRLDGQGYWWAFVGFAAFWAVVIIVFICWIDVERKHGISPFFEF